jgi:nicotinamidase-related amidase
VDPSGWRVDCWAGRSLRLPAGRTALLVIDMQRDFLDPEGMSGVLGEDVTALRAIVPTLRRALTAARRAGLTILHTREGYAPDLSDVHGAKAERGGIGREGPLGRFLIRGEAGQEIVAELRPASGEAVIDKPGFSAFYRTDLEARLGARGISHLVLGGVTSQCCVHSTLRDAVDRGFTCLTLADGTAAFDPELHRATLAIIQGEGHLFGWIADTDALCAALDRGPA